MRVVLTSAWPRMSATSARSRPCRARVRGFLDAGARRAARPRSDPAVRHRADHLRERKRTGTDRHRTGIPNIGDASPSGTASVSQSRREPDRRPTTPDRPPRRASSIIRPRIWRRTRSQRRSRRSSTGRPALETRRTSTCCCRSSIPTWSGGGRLTPRAMTLSSGCGAWAVSILLGGVTTNSSTTTVTRFASPCPTTAPEPSPSSTWTRCGDTDNGSEFHWRGRSCKVYTRLQEGWKLIMHTGLLDY
jgi:hypothetical protein